MARINKLPIKPSDVLALAIKDLEAVERDKKYKINMLNWHDPRKESQTCEVCFAGAVMAKTLKIKETAYRTPESFSLPTKRRLLMLDALRQGNIDDGIGYLETDIVEEMKVKDYNLLDAGKLDFSVVPYEQNKRKFKSQMKGLVKTLRKIGL